MKIIAIRGRNLASLEGDFAIDFTVEPLLSTGIFAICGSTGAGKSTLLDAMCLALFARTPRTDQAKENNVKLRDVNDEVLPQSDPRFLLRRGTASGYAEADFVALNGYRYRARWSVGRARDKENGRLQNPRISLHNLDKEEEEQGTRSDLQSRIIELIGLTFEQFTRSVLLAQNDFSTFLKAEQGEKASLLEKLTGTELYSAISRLIFEKNAEAKEALDAISINLRGIELLTDEEETKLTSDLTAANIRLLSLEKAKVEQQQLQDAIHTTRQQIATREAQQKEATIRLSHAADLFTAARRDYEKGLEEQKQTEATSKILQQEIQQARRLDVQIDASAHSLAEADVQEKEATARHKEAEQNYRNALTRHKEAEAEIVRLTGWFERYRSKERIAEQLAALLLHIDAASASRQAIEKANKAITAIRKEDDNHLRQLARSRQVADQRREVLRQTETSLHLLEEELQKLNLPTLDKEIEMLRNDRERLLIEQAHLAASGTIRELRDKLQNGQPCPVCGSMDHPYKPADPTAHNPVAALTLRLQQLTAKRENYAAGTKQITLLQQSQLSLHKELVDSETACKELIARQQLSAGRLEREEEVIKEHTVQLSQSLRSANRLFGSDEWQKAWQQDPDTFRTTLTDFARRWHANNEQLRELERQQSARKAECESLASFLPSLAKLADEAALQYKKNQAAFMVLQTERAKLLNGHPADQVEQEHLRFSENLKERLNRLLTVQTEQSGIAEQSRGISAQISKDLTEATADLTIRQAAFTKWTADYAASSGDEALAQTLSHIGQLHTELTFRLRIQTTNKAKIAGMQDQLNARRSDSERWAKLNELAGSADGAKFRRIAQGYTLDVLLGYANVQLQGLTRRYRLERVPETLALQVIDCDMCDEVRTVHSLSGGESFLVSLALALGLSSLSSNRMKVESLFIDEGFGSLDAETLRVAMDALESLRTQGRKIGVISHVQEMTERIPVRICVNRAGNGRSFIEIN